MNVLLGKERIGETYPNSESNPLSAGLMVMMNESFFGFVSDKWWDGSKEADGPSSKPPKGVNPESFSFKAKSHKANLIITSIACLFASAVIIGPTTDWVLENVYPEGAEVHSYRGGECVWDEGQTSWHCRDSLGVEEGYWDTYWFYCENQWGDNWFCTDDFGQDPNHENSASMERLVDYRLRDIFWYAQWIGIIVLFSLFTRLWVTWDKQWTRIETRPDKIVLRRWLPFKIRSYSYKEINISDVSKIESDTIWVEYEDTSHDDFHH